MIKPAALLAVTLVTFFASFSVLGYRATYQIGYGAFTLMAASISLTFVWLWRRRATPLAMGMAFSWAGAASVMGWWWLFNVFHAPTWMQESGYLFPFLSIYFLGAVLHFEVIARSFGARKWAYILPIAVCLLASVLIFILV
jgi:hypothetical protein